MMTPMYRIIWNPNTSRCQVGNALWTHRQIWHFWGIQHLINTRAHRIFARAYYY